MTRRRGRDDDGSILLLTLCYAVVALALVLGVTDVSALLLARRSMQATADGAALAVAQDVSVDGLYGDGSPLTLDDQPVLQADADDYVARSDLPDAGVVVPPPTGDTVQVVLRRDVRLPFGAVLDALGIDGTQRVTVSAHARLACLGC